MDTNTNFFPYDAVKFFLYLVFMFLTFTYFTFYGMMAIGLTPTQHLAAVISSAFYSLWNLMSGFLVPKPVSTIFSPFFLIQAKDNLIISIFKITPFACFG